MSPKQKKLAGKAPPPNKLDEKDFAVLRAEKAKGRGMGLQDESVKPGKVKPVKAALGLALGILGAAGAKKLMKKKSTMEPGVTSSKMPINLVEEYKEKAMGKRMGGKVQKANLGLMFMKKAKDKGAKGMEFLSPLAMLKRISGKKMGGVAKYKRGSGLDLPVISSVKPGSKVGKGKTKFKSMEAMRKAKGFKPGESASEFNKRRMALEVGKKALKATTVGKIALGVGAAGVAAQQYLKSKMKKKDEPKKKMGGGMMKRYSKGGGSDMSKEPTSKMKTSEKVRTYALAQSMKDKDRLTERDIDMAKKAISRVKAKRAQQGFLRTDPMPKKMGGGMMQKPMGYSKGTMIKARGCKLGRTRPTKIT